MILDCKFSEKVPTEPRGVVVGRVCDNGDLWTFAWPLAHSDLAEGVDGEFWIGGICGQIRRADPEAETRWREEAAENGWTHWAYVDPPPILWCIHMLGPDTLVPQPSREVANQRAAEMNVAAREYEAKNRSPYAPAIRFEVMLWDGSAEHHAEELAKHGGNPEDWC